MNDNKVETLIWRALQKKGVTFNDMIGLSGYVADTGTNDNNPPDTRPNRFKERCGSERMKEILCQGDYHSFDDYPPLKISLQDLFQFWWDRCIDRSLFVDEILEDIYDYFTEQMRPPVKEPETMDMVLNFEAALSEVKQRKAA